MTACERLCPAATMSAIAGIARKRRYGIPEGGADKAAKETDQRDRLTRRRWIGPGNPAARRPTTGPGAGRRLLRLRRGRPPDTWPPRGWQWRMGWPGRGTSSLA